MDEHLERFLNTITSGLCEPLPSKSTVEMRHDVLCRVIKKELSLNILTLGTFPEAEAVPVLHRGEYGVPTPPKFKLCHLFTYTIIQLQHSNIKGKHLYIQLQHTRRPFKTHSQHSNVHSKHSITQVKQSS